MSEEEGTYDHFKTCGGGGLGALAVAPVLASARAEGLMEGLVGDVEDFRAASEAYVYGYPLVTMEMTRRVMTNVAAPRASARRWGSSCARGPIPTPAIAT